MAMRKTSSVTSYLYTWSPYTSTDIVIAIVNDIDRALLAPSMYLEREVDMTNWDAAFAKMEKDEIHPEDIPSSFRT